MTNKQYAALILLLIAAVLLISIGARSKVSTPKKDKEVKVNTQVSVKPHERPTFNEEDVPEEFGDLRFSFSRTEKNVVVITLDRALSYYFPYIMEELPDTKKDFEGFTYYPNTLSFGSNTIYGMPPCYGGYEYTPEMMNFRDDVSLKEKNNEALKVLPKLFSDNGYSVTVCDPPLANYEWTPDLSIFDGMKGVKAYNTISAYETDGGGEYDKFKSNYFVLDNLSTFTNNLSEKGAYISFDNEATHRYCYLEMPNYTIPESGYASHWGYNWTKTYSQDDIIHIYDGTAQQHYCVNAASLRALGEWFRTLRRLGVYDNTKIIIAADHGYCINTEENLNFGNTNTQYYNPLLLVKDYKASGEYKIDNTLMTNADVPTIATNGVIKNATNPYTGKVLKDQVDKSEVHVYRAFKWRIEENQGNTYGSVYYFKVRDNIFDMNNWGETRIDLGTTKKGSSK
ncbi:MAG: hypothetical protein KBS82_08130 [Oscillospiraceae bacterium]|nr:hypothetical protein [Candidatus Limimonas egerieequi]